VIVLVLGVVMTMGMHVPCAVSMHVFVLVEHDFEMLTKRVGDTAERLQAGDMIAAFQTRNHRLGHPEPSRQLLLRLASMGPQLQQLPRALRGALEPEAFRS
jgi:hypothetical protein